MEKHNNPCRLQAEEQIGGTHHMVVTQRVISKFPVHWHNYFEIEIVLSGEGNHMINGNAYSIGRGNVYILTPVDFHGVEARSPLELINISFEDACLSEEILEVILDTESMKHLKMEGKAFDHIVMGAELLRHECESDGPCKQQLLEYILSKLLHNSKQNQESPSKEHLAGIRKAVVYMQLHFREKITLEQLSKLTGYHPTYFSELFQKVTGETYIYRLKMLRLRYAAVLLSSGLRVTDACYQSGFGSLSNFQASFRDKYGVSPGEYRKMKGTHN